MPDRPPIGLDRASGRYYGWWIVAGSLACAALSGPGQSYMISLFLDSIIEDVGVSRVAVSSLYGSATLAAALCLPFIGRLADRTTTRAFMAGAVGAVALSLLLLSTAHSWLMLAAAFFCLRLSAQGAIGLGVLTGVVRWFHKYRARALAFAGAGYSVGEMVLPIMGVALIAGLGWRGALAAIAAVYLLVAVPLLLRVFRERDVEHEPMDGITAVTGEPGPAATQRPERSIPLREAVRRPVFWGLLAAVCVHPLVITGLVFHLVAIFRLAGWDPLTIPAMLAAYAVTGLASGLGTGLLLERIAPRWGVVLAGVTACMALPALLVGMPQGLGALALGGGLGVASGLAATTNSTIWPAYFGIASLGAIKGVVNGARNAATAVGPPLVAALLGGPTALLHVSLVLGAMLVVSAAAGLVVRAPADGRE